MNKSKKTIISIISALFICFLVVLGLVLFTNKTTTTTISKNTKQVKIEKLTYKLEKEDFLSKSKKKQLETIKKQIEIKNRMNKNLHKRIVPKNKFKRFNFKNKEKSFDGEPFDAKIEFENVGNEESYTPHWVHNHENGFICKSCGRKPMSKNQKRVG